MRLRSEVQVLDQGPRLLGLCAAAASDLADAARIRIALSIAQSQSKRLVSGRPLFCRNRAASRPIFLG